VALLQAGGYTCVLWNAIPRDWADPEGWVETALAQLAREHWTLMVLHDVRSDAMRHLYHFLAEVQERGGCLRQEFPGSCLPITCGRITGPLADFVSSASERPLDGTASARGPRVTDGDHRLGRPRPRGGAPEQILPITMPPTARWALQSA
jgi:hypothetical protein